MGWQHLPSQNLSLPFKMGELEHMLWLLALLLGKSSAVPEGVLKKVHLKVFFAKLTGKHLHRSLFFHKVVG